MHHPPIISRRPIPSLRSVSPERSRSLSGVPRASPFVGFRFAPPIDTRRLPLRDNTVLALQRMVEALSQTIAAQQQLITAQGLAIQVLQDSDVIRAEEIEALRRAMVERH